MKKKELDYYSNYFLLCLSSFARFLIVTIK